MLKVILLFLFIFLNHSNTAYSLCSVNITTSCDGEINEKIHININKDNFFISPVLRLHYNRISFLPKFEQIQLTHR